MHVEQQACPSCHSTEVTNLLVGQNEHPESIYVRCAKCEELIAWGNLNGFFPQGETLERYLKSRAGSESDSGRQWLSGFQAQRKLALATYQEALEQLGSGEQSTHGEST